MPRPVWGQATIPPVWWPLIPLRTRYPTLSCGYNPPLIVRFSIDAPCFLFWLPLIRIKQRLRQNDLPLVLPEGRFWKFLLIPAQLLV